MNGSHSPEPLARYGIQFGAMSLPKNAGKGMTLSHNPDPVEAVSPDMRRWGRKREVRVGFMEEGAFVLHLGRL